MKRNNLFKALGAGVIVFIIYIVGTFFSNAITIGDFPITKTGDFQLNPNSRYVGTEDRNGTPVNIFEYEVQFTKPANYRINLNMNFIDTAESGHNGVNVVSIKTDRGTSLPLQLSNFSNVDLMSGKRHNIDVNNAAFSHVTESNPGKIIYRVEAPVSLPRNYYNLNAYVGGKVTVPAGTLYSPPGSNTPIQATTATDVDLSRFFNPTNNATYATTNLLNSLNSRYESPFLESSRQDNMFIAGDYIKGNSIATTSQIKWTLSVPNTSGGLTSAKENQTFNVPLNLDPSQTKRSAKLILYKPGPNGFVVASETAFNGGDIVVPPDHLAQVVVIADVNNHESKHTFNGAKLDSLKNKISIKKEWLDGVTPVPLTFKLYNQDSWIKDVNLPTGQTEYTDPQAQFKYTLVNGQWKKVNIDVKEVVPSGYSMVQSAQLTSTLEFLFTNIKNFVPPTAGDGECQQYGVFHVDNLKIYEYFKDPSGKQIHDHGGRLFGKFRIPARAKAGDYFDFELPKEIKFEKSPNENVVFFYIYKKSGEKIGEVTILDHRTLRFTLYDSAYSETAYEGDFKVGSLIKRPAGYIARIDGRPTTEQFENRGIIPDLANFADGRPTVSKNVRFTSTYKKGDLGDCPREVSNPFNVSATFLDQEGARHGLIRKEVHEYGKDYITYDILFNGAGENRGTGTHTFVEMLNTTIQPYTGDVNTSTEFYEVTPIRYAYGYDPNSLKPAPKNLGGLVGANYFGYPQNAFPVKLTQRFDIKISNMGTKTFLLRFKARKQTSDNGTYYNWVHYYSGGQRRQNEHQTIGRSDGETTGDAAVNFTNKFSIRINKKDSVTRQKITTVPATFELLNERNGAPGDVISSGRTDENGEIAFLGLDNGTYYVREKEAPVGYAKSNDVVKFRVVNSNTAYYSINGGKEVQYNKVIGIDYNNNPQLYYSLKVRKTDGAGTPLEGSVFRLYNADGSYNVTIGENIVADVYTFGNLSKGRYTLEEVKAPEGYEKIAPIEIEVTDNGITKLNDGTNISSSEITYKASDRLGDISVYNKRKTDFVLKKVKFSNINQTLDGVKFALYKKDENTNIPGTKIGEYTTSNGIISFTNIQDGGYFLKETKTISRYKLSEKYYELNITNGNVQVGSTVLIKKSDNSFESVGHDGMFGIGTPTEDGKPQLLFANRLSSISLKIKKVRLDDINRVIDGVRFELYDSRNGTTPDQKIKDGVTANGGILSFDGLDSGTYFLKEVSTPAPHIHNEKTYKIIVSDDLSTVSIENGDEFISFNNGQNIINIVGNDVEIVFKNDRVIPKFSFNVKKVDADDPEMQISRRKDKSARIQILDSNKNNIRGEVADLTNGVQVFRNGGKNYDPGIYYIKELRSPEGYSGIDKLIKIEITELGEVKLLGLESENGNELSSATDLVSVKKGKLVGTDEDSIEIYIKNESIKGKFKLKKVSSIDGNAVLNGVKFKLLDETGENQIGTDIVTDNTGIAEFNNLKSGKTYYIQEKETVDGYFVNNTKYRVNVDYSGNVNVVIPQGDKDMTIEPLGQDGLLNVVLKNKPFYDLRVVKVDAETGEPINSTNSGIIRFEIESPLGVRYNGEAANFSSGTSEYTFVNTVNRVSKHYGPGTYFIVEKRAPAGYVALPEPIEVRIEENGEISFDNEKLDGVLENSKAKLEIENRTIKISVKNEKPSNKFKLKKIITQDNAPLDNVVFELFKKALGSDKPGEKVGEYTTSNGGEVEFNNLELGEYYLKEKYVPERTKNSIYGLNENYYKVIVTLDNVKIGSQVLIDNGDGTFSTKNIDKKFVEGKVVNGIKELIFKNDIRYRVSFEKNLYTPGRQSRLKMQFNIRAKDQSTNNPILASNQDGNDFSIIEPVNGQINGKKISKGSISWEFTPKSNVYVKFNPIFELSPGRYIVEELNPPTEFESKPFEVVVANDGAISIVGAVNNSNISSNVDNSDKFEVDGEFFLIRQTGYSGTNASLINIFNRREMEFYVDKKSPDGNTIRNGTLKLKLNGANIFDNNGTPSDEKIFDLDSDYVEGKGLRIVIPRNLPSGTYVLSEIEAPETFIKTNMRYFIEISQENQSIRLVKTDEGEINVGGNVEYVNEEIKNIALYSESINNSHPFKVPNISIKKLDVINRKQEYPLTGGVGTLAFMVVGSILMISSAYFIKREQYV